MNASLRVGLGMQELLFSSPGIGDIIGSFVPNEMSEPLCTAMTTVAAHTKRHLKRRQFSAFMEHVPLDVKQTVRHEVESIDGVVASYGSNRDFYTVLTTTQIPNIVRKQTGTSNVWCGCYSQLYIRTSETLTIIHSFHTSRCFGTLRPRCEKVHVYTKDCTGRETRLSYNTGAHFGCLGRMRGKSMRGIMDRVANDSHAEMLAHLPMRLAGFPSFTGEFIIEESGGEDDEPDDGGNYSGGDDDWQRDDSFFRRWIG